MKIFRFLLIGLTCAVAFGLGFELSHAASAYPSCESICESKCAQHDGCQESEAGPGICYYWCMDGYNGEVQTGS
jgi:hypothetical protein